VTAETAPVRPDPAYDASSIVVLPGLEAVRRTPSMYIGSTDRDGLHQLVFELIDNAVDESEAGYGTQLTVVLHDDGSCSVEDHGRGIPVEPHPQTGRPACETVLTTLHAGGKFGGGSYATSAGVHGVGLSCVNALASWLRLDVWRDGHQYTQNFVQGRRSSDPVLAGPADRTGTRVWFQPDPSIMTAVAFSPQVIEGRLEEIAFLHPRLTVTLVDEAAGTAKTLRCEGGVRGFLALRNRDARLVHAEPIVVTGRDGGLRADIAFHWTEGYAEQIWSFVNGVRTDSGGSHLDGLRLALANVINRFAATQPHYDLAANERISTVDILEGLSAVVSLRIESPQFDGQTKRHLRNPEAGQAIQALVEREFAQRLRGDEELRRRIVVRALDATRARLAARLASRTARHERRTLTVDTAAYQRQFGIRSRDWHQSCSWLTDEGLLARHAELCDVPPGARMLDVCCGSGVVGASFTGLVGEMIGLDITPEMVALASTRLDHVYQGTVYDLPFDEASFDLVVNREVLHLLPQPERPLAEIYRVLRPGGQFIVGQIVPYADEDAFWMYRIFKKKQPLLHQMYLEPEFRALLLGAGFVDLTMTEYHLWESIDRWIDTHETTPAHRQEICRLFYNAPAEVRAVHPFEVGADGAIRDKWRWCVYSTRKPA
jgi:DNA gyrase subunit B